jgi:hypothetical protein
MGKTTRDIPRLGLGAAGLGAVAGLAAFAAFGSADRMAPATAASTASAGSARPILAGSVSPVSGGHANLRALIVRAIAEAPVRNRTDLPSYLDGLEARAREQGRVTALEIEPGLEMVTRHGGGPEEIAAFSQRMKKLQAELGGSSTRPESAAASVRARALLSELEQARGDRQQALIREYRAIVEHLPAEEQAEAGAALGNVAGVRREEPDRAMLDTLFRGIETAATQSERQSLIHDYLELVQGLPEEEERHRLELLRARFGSRFGADVSGVHARP